MLKINTKKFDPANWPDGVWGKYAEGVRLKVRKFNSEIIRELRKPFVRVEMEVDKSSRRMVPVEKTDTDALDEALTDFLIQEFEGLGDENGRVLPLNLDSKKFIMNDISLRDWIWAFAQSQEVIAEAAKEEQIKN